MKIKLIILTIVIFLLTGCTSYTELNDLSIVNTLGINYQDGKYELTVSVVEGKIDDQELEKEITILHSKKTTLEEAFQDIYLTSSKKIYLSHIDLLILSENAINYKLKEIIRNFLENNEYRNNFNVILLKDSTINDFFNQKILAEDINNLLKTNEQETSMTKIKDLETIMKELLIDTNSYLPTIRIKEEKIVLSGFTLIKNYKTFEELTLNDSILLNLLTNNTNKTYINNITIFENITTIRTNKNKINITLNMVINNKDNQNKNSLIKDIETFIKKYHQKNYDILKLNETIRKNNYSYWKKTNNLLNKLEIKITIKEKINENYLQGDDFND